jgi:hypothetical protein
MRIRQVNLPYSNQDALYGQLSESMNNTKVQDTLTAETWKFTQIYLKINFFCTA